MLEDDETQQTLTKWGKSKGILGRFQKKGGLGSRFADLVKKVIKTVKHGGREYKMQEAPSQGKKSKKSKRKGKKSGLGTKIYIATSLRTVAKRAKRSRAAKPFSERKS